MGRSWQFILLVAIVLGVCAVGYYSSDYYAQRWAPVEGTVPAASDLATPDTAPAATFGAPATAPDAAANAVPDATQAAPSGAPAPGASAPATP